MITVDDAVGSEWRYEMNIYDGARATVRVIDAWRRFSPGQTVRVIYRRPGHVYGWRALLYRLLRRRPADIVDIFAMMVVLNVDSSGRIELEDALTYMARTVLP